MSETSRKVIKTPEVVLFFVGALLTAWGISALVAQVENSDPNSELPGWFGWALTASTLGLGVGALAASRRIYRRRLG